MGLVRIRLVADTSDELARASVVLMAALGDRVRLDCPARWGHHGHWLAYDTLDTLKTLSGEVDVPTDEEMAGPSGRGWTR